MKEKNMKNSDDKILAEIKQLFEQEIRDDNLHVMHEQLTKLYSQLSYARPYTTQELFPKVASNYKLEKGAISFAKKLSWTARQKWTTDLTMDDPAYFSCREDFKERTGIDVGREYTYPNNMSPQEFQESFNATVLPKVISTAYIEMTLAAILLSPNTSSTIYDRAFGYKLFLEKEKLKADTLLTKAYHQFWLANPNVSGHEKLKKIENFDEMRNFLMGVASEIPLDDVEAFVFGNEETAKEVAKNNDRFKKEFHTNNNMTFDMTDKTWNKYVKPFLEEKKNRSKAVAPKGILKILKKNSIPKQSRGKSNN